MSVFYRDGTQTFVRKENVEEWQDFVTVTQAREILSRYFLQSATTFDVPIAETLYNLPFHLNYATESVEDETLISYQLALRHHLDTHGVETAVTMNQLALVIEEKLPKPSQLLADYKTMQNNVNMTLSVRGTEGGRPEAPVTESITPGLFDRSEIIVTLLAASSLFSVCVMSFVLCVMLFVLFVILFSLFFTLFVLFSLFVI